MRRILLPIVLVWRDKTIDVKGEAALVVPALYIRKGRTLTINGVDPTKRFEFRIGPGPMIVKGDIRLAKKPTEISAEDLRKMCNCAADWTGYPGAIPGCPVHSNPHGAAGGSGPAAGEQQKVESISQEEVKKT